MLDGRNSVSQNFAPPLTKEFWTYTYDDFNRLVSSSCSANCPDGQQTQAFGYVYDRYANRWQQNVTAGSGPQPIATFNNTKNQMDGYSYDADGNLTNDGHHSYTYDAESRIIAVDGGGTATYVYDAEGRRAQKTTANGTVNYIYDIAGNQVGEVSSSGNVNRIEAYLPAVAGAGGKHLATYTNGVIYFNHADWLGTERARTDMAGSECETIVSLPFGDGEAMPTNSCSDASPMHFTGKMRDAETASSPGGTDGLDDFDARYYSSEWGRFISADWSADPEPVPYANFTNPQTLNLYAIVADDPATDIDADGHVLQVPTGDSSVWNDLLDFAGRASQFLSPSAQGASGLDQVSISCAYLDCVHAGGANAGKIWQLINSPEVVVYGGRGTGFLPLAQWQQFEEHQPYSLEPEGSVPAADNSGARIFTYQVVDPAGRPVRDVSVQEHVKVLAAQNAQDASNPNPVHFPTGQVSDRVGPSEPPSSRDSSFLKTQQTFTAIKGGRTYQMSTKDNQYVRVSNGKVTVQVVILVP